MSDQLVADNAQHSKQTCMPPPDKPTISASKQLQTYALDRAATGTGLTLVLRNLLMILYRYLFPIQNKIRFLRSSYLISF